MRLVLNPSYKSHLIIAFLISLWLVLLLVFIAPFDSADLPFKVRLILLPFYGVISFVSYVVLIPIQNWVFRQLGSWNLALEIAFTLVFHALALVGSFAYYQTDWINGTYPFSQFTLEVYYPIFFLLLTILVALRWFLFRKVTKAPNSKILLRGDNKRDTLQLAFADLICISSADNYVEVSYLAGQAFRKRLLRNTLKNMATAHPALIQVHRSYLINPAHFIEWKNANTLQLTQMEVPVSNTYKPALLALESKL